jgi:hypothetical protein
MPDREDEPWSVWRGFASVFENAVWSTDRLLGLLPETLVEYQGGPIVGRDSYG